MHFRADAVDAVGGFGVHSGVVPITSGCFAALPSAVVWVSAASEGAECLVCFVS